ncbi:hypothetical protein J31TS6_62450 [Brevibacillus reuszeri]|uniref:DUF3850 domain-containing protein n=1 Tax=Brevibacillus reuszeri TaxID=54915 RepID=UPI001B0739FA|nr:DUF3850 domain-containing protein [Brevibacillus reuszeri]GIO10217.1 hypothetical protein J31TS6_62450 [Brevibacillus reuszeri]
MIHHLKILPEHFRDVRAGIKTAELRLNDRNYQPGDTLVLLEYNPAVEKFTGEEEIRTVTHVLSGEQWLQPGMVMLSISGREDIETIRYELGNLAEKFADRPTSNVYRHIKHIEMLARELKVTGGERDASRT